VSHLQPTPAAQRRCQQLAPSHHCLHQYPYQQQQQKLHHYADDDVTCKCQLRHRHDMSTVVKLANSHHCHDSSDDDDDDDGECVSPTWQRRSDVDMTDVGRTIDSVDKCQQPSRSSSSSSITQLPSSGDRPQIFSSLSSSPNILVNNVSSMNEDNHHNHMPLTQS